MAESRMDRGERIKLLLEEYRDRRSEIMKDLDRYDKQTVYVSGYVTLIVTGVGLLLATDPAKNTLVAQLAHSTVGGAYMAMLLTFGMIVAYYFYSTVLDILSMIYLNAARCAVLERVINAAAAEELILWDSAIVPRFMDLRFWGYRFWLKPNFLVGIWAFLFLLLVTVVFVVACFVMLPTFFWGYAPAVVVITAFLIFQWIDLHRTGVPYMRSSVERLMPESGTSSIFGTEAGQFSRSPLAALIVGIVTIFAGIVPFLVLSAQAGTLWLSSPNPFPLFAIPTVWVGDGLLLPVFNAIVYYVLVDAWAKRGACLYRSDIITAAGTGCVALVVNIVINRIWLSDPYTSFMELQLGDLSTAGWWHAVFSTMELWVILTFVVSWLFWQSNDASRLRYLARRAWSALVVFTLLPGWDLAIRAGRVYHKSLWQSLRTDWTPSLGFAFVLATLALGRALRLRHRAATLR